LRDRDRDKNRDRDRDRIEIILFVTNIFYAEEISEQNLKTRRFPIGCNNCHGYVISV
jgi:hypothetical protein